MNLTIVLLVGAAFAVGFAEISGEGPVVGRRAPTQFENLRENPQPPSGMNQF
jgi:hypothetical protein